MKKFKFLEESTADLAVKSYGKTIEEAFSNMALAMFNAMVDTKKVKKKISKKIKKKSEDLKSLLYDFLDELLYIHETEDLVFSEFKVKIDKSKMILIAEAFGEKLNKKTHDPKTLIKAVTYHDMQINKNKVWEIKVTFDI